MQNGLRSSSSRQAALLVLSSLLGVAGCSGGAKLLSNGPAPAATGVAAIAPVPASEEISVSDLVTTASITPVQQVPRPAEVPVVAQPTPVAAAREPQIKPAGGVLGMSAWCEYLKEDTAAEASILRSPSLGGSVDDDGQANVNVGLSLMSFHKANLIEQAAEARCRRHLAELGLQKLIFISPQGLTAAGYRAKSERIGSFAKEVAEMRAEIDREIAAGVIDRDNATAFMVQVNELLAEGSEARSQADRRFGAEASAAGDAAQLGSDLLQAESELSDIGSRIRTADSMDVSVHAGWSENDVSDGIERFDDGLSGKVSFSMKLGAWRPIDLRTRNAPGKPSLTPSAIRKARCFGRSQLCGGHMNAP
ncbi:MAG: hypothetical protein HC855_03480 [Rhizobiales bacterium]|nr:hypothetical protein [Hyphomicrobiales bacterium]